MGVQADVLIVGAGLAGLIAAHTLAQQKIRAVVVDQGDVAGGRLATRQIGPGFADCGAQFFTTRTREFQEWVDRWAASSLVYRWSQGWSDGSLGSTPEDGHPRYAVRGGMSALVNHLSRGIDLCLKTRITFVSPTGEGWQARDEAGVAYSARALLLTPPVPLSLDLFDMAEIELPREDRAALEWIEYASNLTGLFWLDREINLPQPGAIQHPNALITWIADNRRKGISPNATIVTVQAGPEYSRQLWSLPDWEALVALESGLRLYKDFDTHIIEARLERWRYAMPTNLHTDRYLLVERGLPPLAFAGDAFSRPRVEGAAISGIAAAKALARKLSEQTARI
jgi:predicted NAD/FAD-dependent oxidoreductase